MCFKFIYLFLAVLGLCGSAGFSLVAGWGLLFVAVCRLLVAVASLARTLGMRISVVTSWGLSSCGSWAPEHRLNSCGTWLWKSSHCIHIGKNVNLLGSVGTLIKAYRSPVFRAEGSFSPTATWRLCALKSIPLTSCTIAKRQSPQ